MKKLGFGALFLLGFAIIETAILSNILILPAIPDLVLICSLYLSVQNGRLNGCCSGFIGGLFMDFLSATPFGLNCLLRTILGYFFGAFNKSLNITGILFPFLFGLLATLVKAFVLWLISLFYPSVNITYHIFSVTFAFQLIFNGILTPVLFRFLDIFKNQITVNPEKAA